MNHHFSGAWSFQNQRLNHVKTISQRKLGKPSNLVQWDSSSSQANLSSPTWVWFWEPASSQVLKFPIPTSSAWLRRREISSADLGDLGGCRIHLQKLVGGTSTKSSAPTDPLLARVSHMHMDQNPGAMVSQQNSWQVWRFIPQSDRKIRGFDFWPVWSTVCRPLGNSIILYYNPIPKWYCDYPLSNGYNNPSTMVNHPIISTLQH